MILCTFMNKDWLSLNKITLELREHSDGRWDVCLVSNGEVTQKLSRLTFGNAIKQLKKIKRLRDELEEVRNARIIR